MRCCCTAGCCLAGKGQSRAADPGTDGGGLGGQPTWSGRELPSHPHPSHRPNLPSCRYQCQSRSRPRLQFLATSPPTLLLLILLIKGALHPGCFAETPTSTPLGLSTRPALGVGRTLHDTGAASPGEGASEGPGPSSSGEAAAPAGPPSLVLPVAAEEQASSWLAASLDASSCASSRHAGEVQDYQWLAGPLERSQAQVNVGDLSRLRRALGRLQRGDNLTLGFVGGSNTFGHGGGDAVPFVVSPTGQGALGWGPWNPRLGAPEAK